MSVSFWAGVALRFLWRSWRATAVLAVMVAGAVASLTLLSALAVGVGDAMVRNSVGLYAGHLVGEPLPAGLDLAALHVPGVSAVLARGSAVGVLSRGERDGPVSLVVVDPEAEAAATALPRKAVAGRYLRAGEPAVFLSRPLAEALAARPGDTVSFAAPGRVDTTPLKVVGVYESGVDRLDRGVSFVPRGALPVSTPLQSVAVFLRAGVEPEAVRETYAGTLPEVAGRFRTWAELMPGLQELIELNYLSMGVVTALVFAVVALGVAGAFVIFIVQRLREHGVMKAMGVSAGETVLMLTLQVGLMSIAAAAAGTVIGVALVIALGHGGIDLGAFTAHNPYFAVSAVVYPRLTAFSAGLPPLLAVGFPLLAALGPARYVARRPAAEILRTL